MRLKYIDLRGGDVPHPPRGTTPSPYIKHNTPILVQISTKGYKKYKISVTKISVSLPVSEAVTQGFCKQRGNSLVHVAVKLSEYKINLMN